MTRVIFLNFFIFLLSAILLTFLTINNSFSQENIPTKQYDLSTYSGRELASIEKPVSIYKIKKCTEIKHTDGDILVFCLANFEGTTGGFYDWSKDLMVVGSLDQYTLIHEITHTTTLHFYKKGFTDITSSEIQEKMAYNAENLLTQINDFKNNFDQIKDLENDRKTDLGIPINIK